MAYNVLSARSAYSLCDGTRESSAVADHERHFGTRWWYEQTRCSNMSVGVSTLVTKKLRRPKHVLRISDAPQKRHLDSENWPEAEGYKQSIEQG